MKTIKNVRFQSSESMITFVLCFHDGTAHVNTEVKLSKFKFCKSRSAHSSHSIYCHYNHSKSKRQRIFMRQSRFTNNTLLIRTALSIVEHCTPRSTMDLYERIIIYQYYENLCGSCVVEVKTYTIKSKQYCSLSTTSCYGHVKLRNKPGNVLVLL